MSECEDRGQCRTLLQTINTLFLGHAKFIKQHEIKQAQKETVHSSHRKQKMHVAAASVAQRTVLQKPFIFISRKTTF